LKQKLSENQKEYFCGGQLVHLQLIDTKSGIIDNRYSGTYFLSGTSMIFSKNSFKLIMDNIDSIDYSIVDDVAFGVLMKKLNLIPESIGSFYEKPGVSKEELLKAIKDLSPIIYRNKNVSDRNIDIQNMKLIITEIKIKY